VAISLFGGWQCSGASEKDAEVEAKPRFSTRVAAARSLLLSGRLEEALVELRRAMAPNADGLTLSILGDIHFRQSEFEEASTAYYAALQADSRNSRARWGLGRIAVLRNELPEAKKWFALAFQADPYDPDIILSFADSLPDSESRTILLENFVKLVDPGDALRREHVTARLELERRVGQRSLSRLASPVDAYHFKLSDYFPGTPTPQGILIRASINGSKPLRLLLDTGAEGVYLDDHAARRLNLEVLTEARIGGLGAINSVPGQVTLAQILSIDNFRLENCMVRVTDLSWLPEADGVIGTDVFKDFLIRLDPKRRTLDLEPLSAVPQSDSEAIPIYRSGHFLLVNGTAPNHSQGYFVVDTGASSTLIASHAATSTIPAPVGEQGAGLRDARGFVRAIAASPAQVIIAGHQWTDREALVLDLREFSQRSGFEVTGVLGYPMLRQSILTINYRDGYVEFGERR
jgi:predicted aspartyl protease